MKQRVEIRVVGRVQGVGFRFFVFRAATPLHVTGFVRNCSDGSVEIVAEGTKKQLDSLIEQVKSVPWPVQIEDFFVHWLDASNEWTVFEFR